MEENKKTIKLEEIENPALVYAMYEMKEKKTKEAEAKFISELRNGMFITPAVVELKGEDGEFRPIEGPQQPGETRIQFMMLKNDDGGIFLPAFTSIDELKKWRKEEKLQTVVCRFEQYLNIIASDPNGPAGLAIDAFGSNILLSRQLLEGLKKAVDERVAAQVFIRDIPEREEEIENVLTDFFKEDGTVEKAYLQLMKRGESITILLIVDSDLPEGADKDEIHRIRKELFDRIAEAVKPALKGNGFTIAGYESDFKNAVASKTPFYTR